jgi:eukaryotic-like serine/threonine-protein kinase
MIGRDKVSWEADAAAALGSGPSPDPKASAEAETVSAFLEDVLLEYYQRLKTGEQPDLDEFYSRYPAQRDDLSRLFRMDRGMAVQLNELNEQRRAKKNIAWPKEGERWGDFTLLRPLGQGGFARVYLASEASTGDRLVVVKFSLLGGREAKTQGRLAHPHVVPILSARYDEASEFTIVCMPYLGSATLHTVGAHLPRPRPARASSILDVVRACAQPEEPTPLPSASLLQRGTYTDGIIQLALPLAQTLAFLHHKGVLHRDLKPSNVLLDPAGKPLLLDFNLSIRTEEAGFVGGTLDYMAPEQLRAFVDDAEEKVDPRVDVFSLGVILYELLTGELPCDPLPNNLKEKELAELLLRRWKAGFRSVRRVGRELEQPVAALLDRCLAFDPTQRPSAQELAAGLQRQFNPARRLRRRILAWPRLALSLLGLLLVAAVAGAFAWTATPPYSEREYRQGLHAYRQGDFAEAERAFDNALRADASKPAYRFARGCARLQQSKSRPDDKEKLNQIVDDLVGNEPGLSSPSTLAVLAYVRIRKQFPQDAINLFTPIRLAEYRPVMALNNRAYCYMAEGRLEKAKEDLDQAAEYGPPCQAVLYNRAMLALALRRQDANHPIGQQALADMEDAIPLGPATASLFFDAARLYAQAALDEAPATPRAVEAPIRATLALPTRQARANRALHYLRRAIEAGQPVNLGSPLSILHRALHSHPEFGTLQNLKPRQVLPWRELRLIDPVELSAS